MAEFAKDAIDKFPPSERNFTGLIMGLSAEDYKQILQELDVCRKKIARIALNSRGTERVYRLNLQFFPLTWRRANKMLKKSFGILTCACLYVFFACSDEDVAGVTEQENAIAFEVETPNSYDLWSYEVYRINTGTDNAGNWFSYDNAEMGRGARVVLPAKTDSVLTDEDMAAVIDSCGGLCGTVEFDDSSDSASAGIGFTLGKKIPHWMYRRGMAFA
jgi:hypothetical protein